MKANTIREYVERNLVGLLGSMFKGVDFKGRFSVQKELDVWRDDIESVWEVKKGKRAETYSVFFDDEIIFSFSDDDTPNKVRKMFLSGFLEAYQAERVYLNKELYKEREERERLKRIMRDEADKAQQNKDLERLSPEEKSIANEVLKEVKKGK